MLTQHNYGLEHVKDRFAKLMESYARLGLVVCPQITIGQKVPLPSQCVVSEGSKRRVRVALGSVITLP